VQELLKRVIVRPSDELSRRFPAEMPCRLTVYLRDGRVLIKEKTDYEGFRGRPMSWSTVALKFERLAQPYVDRALLREIEAAVENLDGIKVRELTEPLAHTKAAE
jgi:2-methylcitrate dehydratase